MRHAVGVAGAFVGDREHHVSVSTAELERKLAEDWSNVDVLAAHKRSRDALQALLERWETLFEEAQA